MTNEDILKLGSLARITLQPDEIEQLKTEISDILDYVSTVQDLVADDVDTKQVGARFNVFRKDEVTNQPEAFTAALLAEMPATNGRYLEVKKILKTED